MNKIDQFFKKRLDANSSDKDGWNIPSEDLWNAALPHFPKEEKKRKSLLWLWLSVGILFSSSMIYYLPWENKATNEFQQEITLKEINETIKSQTINNDDNSIINLSQKINIADLNENEEKEKSISETLANASSIVVEEKIFLEQETKVANQNVNGENENILKGDQKETLYTQESNSIYIASGAAELDTKNSSNTFNDVGNEISQGKTVSEVEVAQEESIESIAVSEERSFDSLEMVEGLNLTPLAMSMSNELFVPWFSLIKPKVTIHPKMEAGVSTQYFVLNMVEGADLDESDNGTVFFDGRFVNLNLKFAYWIGRKWSISTGINYGDILLNLDLDTDFEYNEDDFQQDISSEYNGVFSKEYNSGGNGSPVVLKPGVELMNGDVVRLKGQVDLGLRAIQIPFILNYHWYNKRFEFYTGLGFAVESIWAREENLDFNLLDNNILLTEPSTQNDSFDHYFDYSFYGKLGTKFNFNKQINFDAAISILANDVAFSGLEFGLHYRWHK